jgi:hypothetical protein
MPSLTFIAAYLSYRWIEQPALGLFGTRKQGLNSKSKETLANNDFHACERPLSVYKF